MSNLELRPVESRAGGLAQVAAEPVLELQAGRQVVLGGPRGMAVTRTLPNRDRRLVGAWCFLDHYGPQDLTTTPGMRVPPHPHIGLQTVSWLVDGEVLHRDSLGSLQVIQPGQLNLMTAGRAIAHSEETPPAHSRFLHGVQLWTALPGRDRHVDPDFGHHANLPTVIDGDALATVIMGDLGGVVSPARVYSPLVGAEVQVRAGTGGRLPLRPDWEYAVLTLAGVVSVEGLPLSLGPLLYLGSGRADLSLASDHPGRVLLIGGEPFDEQIVMWWNFVARDHDEIVEARKEWMNGQRFGTVRGYTGDPLPAPPMPTTRLKPRGRHR